MVKFNELKNMLQSSTNYQKILSDDNLQSFKNIVKNIKNNNKSNNDIDKDHIDNSYSYDNDEKNNKIKEKIDEQRSIIKNNDGSNGLAKLEHFTKQNSSNLLDSITENMDTKELRRAIVYSEIIGKPKCKSRRRDRRKYGL